MLKKNIIILGLLFASALFAKGDGGHAGSFLRMGVNARARALGEAYTAVADGAIASFYNPGVIPHFQSKQVDLSYSFLPLDRKLSYIGFATPIQPPGSGPTRPMRAGIAAGWIHAGVDNIDGRDFSGNHTMDYSYSENAFYLSFAVQPHDKLGIGISAKYLQNSIPDLEQNGDALSTTGFGIDVGVYFQALENLSLAAAVHDINSSYTWNTDQVYDRGTSITDDFPMVYRLSAAYTLPQDWAMFVVDVENSDKQDVRLHVGAEFTYADVGALRVGWDEDQPTFGLGFFFNIYERPAVINYAFVPGLDGISADHIFSWTFKF